MILAGKISVDRLAARQTKVESGFSKFCKETKATIKYFTDQLEDSDRNNLQLIFCHENKYLQYRT